MRQVALRNERNRTVERLEERGEGREGDCRRKRSGRSQCRLPVGSAGHAGNRLQLRTAENAAPAGRQGEGDARFGCNGGQTDGQYGRIGQQCRPRSWRTVGILRRNARRSGRNARHRIRQRGVVHRGDSGPQGPCEYPHRGRDGRGQDQPDQQHRAAHPRQARTGLAGEHATLRTRPDCAEPRRQLQG